MEALMRGASLHRARLQLEAVEAQAAAPRPKRGHRKAQAQPLLPLAASATASAPPPPRRRRRPPPPATA
ncbi:hypothetical protein ACP70R_023188 [Stipagrostis hirtigluma subsp. patula]